MPEHTMRKRRHVHLVIRHILLHMRSWLHRPQLHHTDKPVREPSVRQWRCVSVHGSRHIHVLMSARLHEHSMSRRD